MDIKEISNYIQGRQLVSAFLEWVRREKADTFSRQTYYNAVASTTPTRRQRLILEYAVEFLEFHRGQLKPIAA